MCDLTDETLKNYVDRQINNSPDPYSTALHLARHALKAGMRNSGGMNDHEFKILHDVRGLLESLDPAIKEPDDV